MTINWVDQGQPRTAFEDALENNYSGGIKPGLKVITELLRQLGDPHLGLPVIHIAGTNGKGSVSAMLERCLREAGFRTGMYTSPHMISYNERFRVNGEMISDETLLALLEEIDRASVKTEEVAGKRPTIFEALTAMAFLWFSREKVEALVLETGMGGRFDATNVIPSPLLTIITSVSMDHEAFLGDTLAKIAGEKAGIIKAGVPLITASENPEAFDVIRREFDAVQSGAASSALPPALFVRVGEVCTWETASLGLSGQTVDLKTPTRSYGSIHLPMPGQYQCANLACVALAWELLSVLGPERLTEEALRKGLSSLRWPCRLEQVQEKPAVVLDGSHNPDGLRQLAVWLSQHKPNYEQIILVMGMVEDKDRLSAARQLDGLVSRVIITKPLTARAGNWQELAKGFQGISQDKVEFIEDCHQALKTAVGFAGENDLVLCTGSFYLVGELRKNWADRELFSI